MHRYLPAGKWTLDALLISHESEIQRIILWDGENWLEPAPNQIMIVYNLHRQGNQRLFYDGLLDTQGSLGGRPSVCVAVATSECFAAIASYMNSRR